MPPATALITGAGRVPGRCHLLAANSSAPGVDRRSGLTARPPERLSSRSPPGRRHSPDLTGWFHRPRTHDPTPYRRVLLFRVVASSVPLPWKVVFRRHLTVTVHRAYPPYESPGTRDRVRTTEASAQPAAGGGLAAAGRILRPHQTLDCLVIATVSSARR